MSFEYLINSMLKHNIVKSLSNIYNFSLFIFNYSLEKFALNKVVR